MSEVMEKRELVPTLRFPEFRGATILAGDADIYFKPINDRDHSKDLPILAITQDQGAVPRDLIGYNVSVTNASLATYKVVREGDFIISLRSFQGGIERSSYTGICSPAYIVLRADRRVDADFFRHYFKTKEYIAQLNRELAGIRDGKMISYSQFARIPLPLPPVAEQRKIAECLDSLEVLIAAETEKLEALKRHKKGLLQQLFPAEGETTPRLRFPKFCNAREWTYTLLEEVAENLDNRRIPISSSQRVRGGTPYYGASGIVDYVEGYIFDETLLCVSEDGANLVARSTPIAFTIEGQTWVNNHAHVLKFTDSHIHSLVEAYLNQMDLGDFLTGMAQPKLNRGMLDTIAIPLPSLQEEAASVAEVIITADIGLAESARRLNALHQHKDALMQQLFPSMEEEHPNA
jgi:type I restriction enzyme S subunit